MSPDWCAVISEAQLPSCLYIHRSQALYMALLTLAPISIYLNGDEHINMCFQLANFTQTSQYAYVIKENTENNSLRNPSFDLGLEVKRDRSVIKPFLKMIFWTTNEKVSSRAPHTI